MFNHWEMRTEDLIELREGLVAEIVAPTEDGIWLPVQYCDAADPEDRWLVGTFDTVHFDEIVARRWEHRN